MKSAYTVLGVPGNVSKEDLETVYADVLAHFTKEKLAQDPSLFDKLNEVKEAHKILSNADLRSAHDRKLNGLAAPAVRIVTVADQKKSSASMLLALGAAVVVAMFAIGTYFSHVREQARRDREARELVQKKEEQEQEARAQAEKAAADIARASANATASINERQLRLESAAVLRQAQATEAMQLAARNRQEQLEKNSARSEERQRQYEQQQRAAEDQRRLRSLCILNYGRPNC